MTPGPLEAVELGGELALLFGAQRIVARAVDPEFAATLAAAPGLAIAAETVARQLELLAEGIGVDREALLWCASALRQALPGVGR